MGWNGALHSEPSSSGFLVPGSTGAAAFAALDQNTLAGFTYAANFTFRTPPLAVGVILAIKTKTGHFSKVLVTALTPANGSGSITLQFTTFGVGDPVTRFSRW